MSTITKVVLAYSGGLDTSVILKWIKKHYACEVVTVTCDLGQEEELDGLEAKALHTGAAKAYIDDLREEFAKDFIFPMLRAGAIYEGRYLLGTSIARPLIAKRLVEVARAEGAQAVAHGATGKGNDQVRFELAVGILAPELRTIAPWREWDFASRTDLIRFAKENGIPVPSDKKGSDHSMPGREEEAEEALRDGGGAPSLQSLEKSVIIDALRRSGGIQHRAARELGITPRQMGYRVRKFNLESLVAVQRVKNRV